MHSTPRFHDSVRQSDFRGTLQVGPMPERQGGSFGVVGHPDSPAAALRARRGSSEVGARLGSPTRSDGRSTARRSAFVGAGVSPWPRKLSHVPGGSSRRSPTGSLLARRPRSARRGGTPAAGRSGAARSFGAGVTFGLHAGTVGLLLLVAFLRLGGGLAAFACGAFPLRCGHVRGTLASRAGCLVVGFLAASTLAGFTGATDARRASRSAFGALAAAGGATTTAALTALIAHALTAFAFVHVDVHVRLHCRCVFDVRGGPNVCRAPPEHELAAGAPTQSVFHREQGAAGAARALWAGVSVSDVLPDVRVGPDPATPARRGGTSDLRESCSALDGASAGISGEVVEVRGLEPLASTMPLSRSTN